MKINSVFFQGNRVLVGMFGLTYWGMNEVLHGFEFLVPDWQFYTSNEIREVIGNFT